MKLYSRTLPHILKKPLHHSKLLYLEKQLTNGNWLKYWVMVAWVVFIKQNE
ncbi:MAG: hypothetical protein GWN00_30615, partial [Aliifodinibius sp.]|nr:hypothetical protein [Fodinibius sp.]NIV15137.1 hypothetical protein [Fodinibius sp.]NIY28981.1 hypothetical protein [Fodinibius sp.]